MSPKATPLGFDKEQQKERYERQVADNLCESLGNDHSVMMKLSPPAPDFQLNTPSGPVTVELARYREQGPYNEANDRDWRLILIIHDQWLNDDAINIFTPTLRYRKRPSGRFTIPDKNVFQPFYDELRKLALHMENPSPDTRIRFLFRDRELVGSASRFEKTRNGDRRRIQILLVNEEWPILSRFCEEIRFSIHPEHRAGMPSTSLNTRFTGLDSDEIKQIVQNKLGNLPQYRNTTPLPVWLLVHSDGWPRTARLPTDNHLNMAVELVRKEISASSSKFDAIFWMDHAVQGKMHRRLQRV